MSFVRFSEVAREFDHVDDPDALERMKTSMALRAALEICRPKNWWGLGLDAKKLLGIARKDGIPLTWVPDAKIVTKLASAPSREARSMVIETHEDQILLSCSTVLDVCSDPWLADDVALAKSAMAAYLGGHHQAAMALAVCLGEPLALWASTPRAKGFKSAIDEAAWRAARKKLKRYRWASIELERVGEDPSPYEFYQCVFLAPIPRFFTPWFPGSDEPLPSELSRHVVAHQPTVKHFSRQNSLVALMLVASILREQQAWSEEVRMEGS